MLRVAYGFRYLPPRPTLTRLSSAGFRNDDVLSVGSDLGRAHDSASRLPEVMFGGALRENGVNTEQRRFCSRAPRKHFHLERRRTLCLSALPTIRAAIAKELRLCDMAPCLWEMKKSSLRAGDIQGLSDDLLEAARRRNLSDK